MAQSPQTGNPIMTTANAIADLLASSLSPDWTIEGLAEQLLSVIASWPSEESQEFILDANSAKDRQSRRLIRPLLACLAAMSAAEAGLPANLYCGRLSFKRPGLKGSVWILGQFDNRHGCVRVSLRRVSSLPESCEEKSGQRAKPA